MTFTAGSVAMPELAALQPAFSFVLDDLAKVSDKALLARALGPLATLTLWLFRDGRSPGKVAARLRRWGPQMLTLLERSGGRSELVTLLRYLFEVVDKRSFEKVEREIRALPAPIAEVGMTIAELLKKRGFDLVEGNGAVVGRALFEQGGLMVPVWDETLGISVLDMPRERFVSKRDCGEVF